MGHLYHGYVINNRRVNFREYPQKIYMALIRILEISLDESSSIRCQAAEARWKESTNSLEAKVSADSPDLGRVPSGKRLQFAIENGDL